jgi:hypothetical protein
MHSALAYQPEEEAMMQRVIRKRGLMVRGGITCIGVAALVAINAATLAQTAIQNPPDPNQKQVFLIRKDTAECSGSDVPNVDSPLVGGNVVVTRLRDETTRAEVAMTAKPNTTYQFSLKCVRRLGDITTDDEGVAIVSFTYPTNSVGNAYAFEMQPEGAPPENRYQSAQVAF